MDKKFEEKYLSQAAYHWWTKARRDMVVRILRGHPTHTRVLDIGCGGGELLRDLYRAGFSHVTGADISEEAISFCKSQHITAVYRMDAIALGFPDNSFDVIIASDVLEHIQDDEAALREWRRVLTHNGVLILFVPAFMFLWSSHDEINHHYRRYAKNPLQQRVTDAGFLIQKTGYWNFLLFMPIVLLRLLKRILQFLLGKKDTSDRISELGTGFLNTWLSRIVLFENALIQRGFSVPIGSSIYVVAEKK